MFGRFTDEVLEVVFEVKDVLFCEVAFDQIVVISVEQDRGEFFE